MWECTGFYATGSRGDNLPLSYPRQQSQAFLPGLCASPRDLPGKHKNRAYHRQPRGVLLKNGILEMQIPRDHIKQHQAESHTKEEQSKRDTARNDQIVLCDLVALYSK